MGARTSVGFWSESTQGGGIRSDDIPVEAVTLMSRIARETEPALSRVRLELPVMVIWW